MARKAKVKKETAERLSELVAELKKLDVPSDVWTQYGNFWRALGRIEYDVYRLASHEDRLLSRGLLLPLKQLPLPCRPSLDDKPRSVVRAHPIYEQVPVDSSRIPPAVKPKRVVRFPGICEQARLLGVSRQHLFLVLSGQRDSVRLMTQYNQLKASK